MSEKYEQLKKENKKLRAVLEFYANYPSSDKEVPSFDVDHLKPERVAVIKPLDKIGQVYKDANAIHQDDMWTYGPKFKIGRLARELLDEIKKTDRQQT